MVNHGLQPINLWVADRLQPSHFRILLILASELAPDCHPYLYFNVQYSFACCVLSGSLACLLGRRQMFTVVNHGLQLVNSWVADILQPSYFGILLILVSELSPAPHPCLYFNVQVHWYMCIGGWNVYPCLCVNDEVKFCMLHAVRRPIFTVVNHGLQLVNPWETLAFCLYWLLSCHHTPIPVCISLRSYGRFKIWYAPNEMIMISSKKIEQWIGRMYGHDVWLKLSWTRHDKAIIIGRLQASVNNLNSTLLEKEHAVKATEETNTKLTFAVSCAQRHSRAWMEEGNEEAPYSSPKDVRQTLVQQGLDIALVEAHRAASKWENVHEDHDKYAAVMSTTTPL
ncbi:hypothetical protein Cgig2_023057 [Carnegiea gigantea]|uniref:Uncharacterized protein n=1 Tax=Carnegiea gigantea TaxID=171969 RepID=A0A9Q1Q8K0_9CARY|nr:hypothetical protein Cgig2_023057 [Carnegiea gigantea]